jgi:hypothetical protein
MIRTDLVLTDKFLQLLESDVFLRHPLPVSRVDERKANQRAEARVGG